MIDKYDSQLFAYMSEEQKDLIRQGYHILKHVEKKEIEVFDDYSFVVFPFAKAYEGFLKQFFLDAGYISEKDYFSDHFRVGKALTPNLARRLGKKSVYQSIQTRVSSDLADEMWETWKKGRNQVFHYFPHNLRSLTLYEAKEIIDQIITTMEKALKSVKIIRLQRRLKRFSDEK